MVLFCKRLLALGLAHFSPMNRVLIIEDQQKLRRNLQQVCEQQGYEVVAVEFGQEGLHAAMNGGFDALVLDLTLPDCDGLTVLRELRKRGNRIPVLILTARHSIDARVAGLDGGADDYLAKPFSHAELLARIRAMLRRGELNFSQSLTCGDLQIHLVTRRVFRANQELELSQREFELLEYLVRHKNEHMTRERLARDVWKEPGEIMTNAIDVCINGLRRKIESDDWPKLIQTIRGVGYCVKDPG